MALLPTTTYRTTRPLHVSGTIHYNAPISASFEYDLPSGVEFSISLWTEPDYKNIQVWPSDPKLFVDQVVDKEMRESSHYDSYSFSLPRETIEKTCVLTTDFSQAIYFYSTTEAYAELSNFYEAPFYDEQGVRYMTVEHYYQAHKFTDQKYREKIILASSAKEAAALGRSRSVPIVENWDEVRNEIMKKALDYKFIQHPELLRLLAETGDKLLIEKSPYDYYWGLGKEGTGFNQLGTMLMRIRSGK